MIRMMYFIRKPEDMFIDDFKARWEQHGNVVYNNAAALGIRKYIQATTLGGDPSGELLREIYGLTKEPYDAVGEFWWQGRADLADALKTPEGQAAAEAILEDERGFVDWSRSVLYFAVDKPQINPPGVIVAREESTILKGYYVAPVHPELTVRQAQYHWLTCHGPLARQYEQFLAFKRYLQVHVVKEPIADEWRAARSGMEEQNPIGHAEVWMDRRELAGDPTPEMEEAFFVLTMDIATFVDVSEATAFVAREHVVVDQKIIKAELPLPTAFDDPAAG